MPGNGRASYPGTRTFKSRVILSMSHTNVTFDLQPTLTGELLELRPMRADDFDALFQAASDPLIWEQHPEPDRYKEPIFRKFFDGGMRSGGAIVAIDRATGQIIGSSRY